MAQKIWFFPPSFNFLPDGEVSLGSIIPHPSRPTLSLASLDSESHPEIALPKINTFTESDHLHSQNKSTSLTTQTFLKLVSLALQVGNVHASRFTKTTYGSIDLETRAFGSGMSEDTLKAIVGLARVKKHIDGGMFGKRPVYIISGLRIAKDSFQVTSESGSTNSTSAGVSTSTVTGPPPVTGGGNVTSNREQGKNDSYKSAPGVVFAYRLHVIRVKGDGDIEAELFSHRTAFLTGEGEDEDSEEEWEYGEVSKNVLLEDLEIDPDFNEYSMGEEGQESCIAFKHF
ncbi:uncharacterized protein TRIVIDRAFT_222955 [Trichoderma virens Gv29-8]|uniref:Uncharacterized protein n=1 Tax=Hypocrea virens (strain Gv29-8 / FGSC 10586) TaxID=413071 RepID=G9MVL3_HYPVG|nr:uncharacterized protein TRIVIDRAFT_222955 [Trichoderma virens Gv29-8]EHK21511.1 hypothetical protein TRIVIDRAFT_222955 [Trichoderma virens Gv29-8]UKZ53449.1 hypothetical protein TrVGV298_007241 [Trichoderma virens]